MFLHHVAVGVDDRVSLQAYFCVLAVASWGSENMVVKLLFHSMKNPRLQAPEDEPPIVLSVRGRFLSPGISATLRVVFFSPIGGKREEHLHSHSILLSLIKSRAMMITKVR